MKILQIASVFPVEHTSLNNPYVKNFILHYVEKHPSEVKVIKPVAILPEPLIGLTDKQEYWRGNAKKCRVGKYKYESLPIDIFPYFTVGSKSALHTFFSYFSFFFNKKKIGKIAPGEFDLVHAHFLFPDGILAYRIARKYKIPFFLTIRQELRFLKNPFSRYWVKKLIKNATVVSTHSPQMLQGLQNIGIDKISFLPTGIEEYFLNPEMNGDQLGNGRYGKKDKLKLLSVCNLWPIKNLEAVLTAISQMKEKEKIDYTIYGTGPQEQSLKEMVAELQLQKQVHFMGTVKNRALPEIMRTFDVFIQPSFKETYGLSYFEALASGLPVILTKNTGAYELIKNKEVYYLVDPYKPASIANCLQGIIENRKTLEQKSVLAPEVAKIASWENFVEYFHRQYEKVVAKQ